MTNTEEFMDISCPAGTFRGRVLTTTASKTFLAFRGIPFALPPVGHMRFEDPQPQPTTEGVYDATQEGPISIQPEGIDIGPNEQEDCLYLNVFLPYHLHSQKRSLSAELKKVLVNIHGGGYIMGSANQFVPGDLVCQADIIVVTVNYRLHWLGFLTGNLGLWDQILALKWVQTNIRAFGGDETDVTISGESMGGVSVAALSMIEQAKGLFTKGIIMGGQFMSSPTSHNTEDKLMKTLVTHLELTDEFSETLSKQQYREQLINRLKELPASRFKLPVHLVSSCFEFISIDGKLIKEPVYELAKNVEQLKKSGFYDRTYLVTLTNNEGAIEFFGTFLRDKTASQLEVLKKNLNLSQEEFDKVLHEYTETTESKTDQQIPIAMRIMSDATFAVPTFQFLDLVCNGPEKGEAYFLLFNHFPKYLPKEIQGTPHALELSYLFDCTPEEILACYYNLAPTGVFDEEDKRLKRKFIDIVQNFIKTGNPGKEINHTFKEKWKPFTKEKEIFLKFGVESTVQQQAFHKSRCLWVEKFGL